jgi:para-nitrobenzyl esterase
MESGGCLVATKGSREKQGVAIEGTVGCSGAQDVPKCLRSKPASDFLASPPSGFSPFIFTDTQRAWEMLYGPNLDGYIFPDAPMELIKKGRGSVVPLTIGSNANEFDLFIPPGTVNTCAGYWALMQSLFPNHATQIAALYDCLSYPLARFAATDVGTDFMFTCPARRIARAALQGGAPSVHRYYDPHTYKNSPLSALRAFHASEVPFVFRTFDAFGYIPTTGDLNVSTSIESYWTQFARTGDPNGGGAPEWPSENLEDDVILVLDDAISPKNGIESARCDFWDSIAEE